MKKKIFFCMLFAATSLFQWQCQEIDQWAEQQKAQNRPQSSGRLDEVTVIMEPSVWADTIGGTLRTILTSAYPALPQAESQFDINYIKPDAFSSLMKRIATILVIGHLDQPGSVKKMIEDQIARYPDDKKPAFAFQIKDQWSSPQRVIYLYAQNEKELLKLLQEKPDYILDKLYDSENRKALNAAFASGYDKGKTEFVESHLDLILKIPKSYREVVKEPGFVWFRQDVHGEVSNLFIHSVPYSDTVKYSGAHPILYRDQLGKAFVKSDTPGSYMISDTSIFLDQEVVKIGSLDAIETRSLWRLSKDFMGGPFINYTIDDPVNKRIIMLDGWVYAPQFKKRAPIRKLEVLMKNISFDKPNNVE